MFRGGVIVQASDPVAVEFVDGGIDAVAVQPTFTEGAGIAKGGTGAAFGEPGVFAEERFEAGHALEVSFQIWHGRAADVEFAIAVVVEFEREVRFLAGGDLLFEPLFQGVVFGGEVGIGGFVPIAVEVFATKVEAGATGDDAIHVRHGKDKDAVALKEFGGAGIIAKEALDESFDNPTGAGFPWMSASPQEEAMWSGRMSDANDFKGQVVDGFADGFYLDAGMIANGGEEALEIGEAIGFDASYVERRAWHGDGEASAIGLEGFEWNGSPIATVRRNDGGF